MRIAVLCQRHSWYFADLQRAAGGEHQLFALDFAELATVVGPQVSFTGGEPLAGRVAIQPTSSDGSDLRSYDALLVRTMPPGSLEQVVFRMDLLARLEAAGVAIINGPKAIEAAVDKYLTTAKLQAAGLRVPRTAVCQTWRQAMEAFELFGRDCVLKPVFGGEGRGIARLTDEAIAQRTFRLLESLGAILYLQEFIPHTGFDIRVLCVGEAAWAMRRTNADDWRTNVSRGGQTTAEVLTEELHQLASRSAKAVGAEVAGVDLLPDGQGGFYTLEVNAVPGWKALAATLEVDIAAEVLRYVARRAFA